MYRKLLVPLDGSPTARLALREAAMLARAGGARIVLLHVAEELTHSHGFEPPEVYIQDVRPRFLAAGQALLDEAKAQLEADGIGVDTVLLESSGQRVAALITEQAAIRGADLIVLGTHGRRGVDRLLLGSAAEQVARIAPVPVMLVRERPGATA